MTSTGTFQNAAVADLLFLTDNLDGMAKIRFTRNIFKHLLYRARDLRAILHELA